MGNNTTNPWGTGDRGDRLFPVPPVGSILYRERFVTGVRVEDLISSLRWEQHTPTRMEVFYAETEGKAYTYGENRGRRTYYSKQVVPPIDAAMVAASALFAEGHPHLMPPQFDWCFCNLYHDETNHLGWHSDDSEDIDPDSPIAIISFGQPRELWWRPKGFTGGIPDEWKVELANGSILYMPPRFQQTHEHRIPKGGRRMTPRVSLTLRCSRKSNKNRSKKEK